MRLVGKNAAETAQSATLIAWSLLAIFWIFFARKK